MIGAIQESRRIYIPSYRFFVESSMEPLVREKGRDNTSIFDGYNIMIDQPN
jgi:hypothetical protein